MILNVQILNPALRTFAKILVERHSIPVERKLYANLFIIVLYVNVHLNGLAIHIINATNVSLIMTVRTKFLHMNYCFFADECRKNSDCPQDKACLSENCINPCVGASCGQNALCEAISHRAKCTCASGLQGNPYVACLPVGCSRDSDCQDREQCDLTNQKCKELCSGNRCATGAECFARNHREICSCIPPLEGDGGVFCTSPIEADPEPECRLDHDCPPKMACIQERCQNPCQSANPCQQGKLCDVVSSHSGRPIVACSCPEGQLSNNQGYCISGL